MSKHVLAALSSPLFTAAWWKAASLRALRTAVTIAIPYLGTAILFSGVPWLSILSAAALGYIASLVTSLAGIPEAAGKTIPAWLALLERTVKTVAQGIAVGIGNAVLFTDVHWSTILQAALISGLGSLLIGVLGYLPEAASPIVAPQNPDGSFTVTSVPATASSGSATEAPSSPYL
ncbi:hypothetical protein [Leifsonia sp. WHRI 6310E]|uniref:hypothetical protein n=1 Tax=Leifsonia sp. WHRI 6310E TaxID=3162562 RepID=UPI0032EAF6DD